MKVKAVGVKPGEMDVVLGRKSTPLPATPVSTSSWSKLSPGIRVTLVAGALIALYLLTRKK